MVHEGVGNREFLIYALTYSSKLGYSQLIIVLIYENSPPNSHEKGYLNQTFTQNLEQYV